MYFRNLLVDNLWLSYCGRPSSKDESKKRTMVAFLRMLYNLNNKDALIVPICFRHLYHLSGWFFFKASCPAVCFFCFFYDGWLRVFIGPLHCTLPLFFLMQLNWYYIIHFLIASTFSTPGVASSLWKVRMAHFQWQVVGYAWQFAVNSQNSQI